MAKIAAVCISEKKGTPKRPVECAYFRENWGIEGDAHAGSWHRQISLLSKEKIDQFRADGADVRDGDFGENLIVEGLDLPALPVGTRLQIGSGPVLLEISQIGKDCHDHCAIYKRMGDCIMPREGIFAIVLKGGPVKAGDPLQVFAPEAGRPYTAAVLTLSDKGSRGQRRDESGPLMEKLLQEAGYDVKESFLLSDDPEPLERELIRLADQRRVDVIFTSGGTGFSPRDNTPEATAAVCDRMAPGIAQALTAYSMSITPRAMFSRAVSGIRRQTLIINLPGSPKAVQESLDYLLPLLGHGLDILRGTGGECARH